MAATTNKKVWIYCGVPGAGKSTHVAKHGRGVAIHSADHFFTNPDDGTYNFNPAQLAEAHGMCLRQFVTDIQAGEYTIIVDNTNTTVAEIAPYAAIALAYGYELEIVTVLCDPLTAYARNVHGVPFKSIKAMDARLRQRQMLPWWKHTVIDNTTKMDEATLDALNALDDLME